MSRKTFWKNLRRDRQLVFMLIPVVIFFAVFSYYPLYGILIAFKDYSISKGILGSPWAGLRYFRQFFLSPYFGRLLRNTVLISVYSLTGKRINFFGEPEWFRAMYVGSGVWQEFGWNSIIYLAAITGINPDLYEAARIDGAGRLRQIWHVTLPGIKPTILTLLILNLGNIMSVGYEKIILLYSPTTYETADVISTYVYRTGLLSQQYSYAGAVGLFNSVINIAILVLCNFAGKKLFGVGIW